MMSRRTIVLIVIAIALGLARWIDAAWFSPDLEATVPAVESIRSAAQAFAPPPSSPGAGAAAEVMNADDQRAMAEASLAATPDGNLFVARGGGMPEVTQQAIPPVEQPDAPGPAATEASPSTSSELDDTANGAPSAAPLEPGLSIIGTWQDPRGRSALVLGADGVVQAYAGTRIDATFRLRSLEPGEAVFERSTDGSLLRLTLPPAQASQE